MLFGERPEAGDLVGNGAELTAVHQVGRFVVDEVRSNGELAGFEVVLDGFVGSPAS